MSDQEISEDENTKKIETKKNKKTNISEKRIRINNR